MTSIQAINDFVVIEPIEKTKEGAIELLRDINMHRRGRVHSVGDDITDYKTGDLVVYPDTCKVIDVDRDTKLHLVQGDSIMFKELD